MFFTSIAYDYYKAFVTAFIEINGQPQTIFGKPPTKKVVPIVNTFCLMEIVVYLIGIILLMIKLAFGWTIWMFMFPFWIYFGTIFFLMGVLFILFTISMFKYAKSIGWIVALFFIIPVVGINILMCFGGPFLFTILLPLQHGTDLWQTPKAWDSTLPLALAMFGALLKCFVRPTEDDENPYAHDVLSWVATIIYVVWFICMFLSLVLGTIKYDRTLPITNTPFDIIVHWALAAIPIWIGQGIVTVFFGMKAAGEWRLAIKKHDPNGDAYFKASVFSVLVPFLICLYITEVLAVFKLERDRWFQAIPDAMILIPLLIGVFFLFIITLVPFFVKKRADASSGEKEMLTPI